MRLAKTIGLVLCGTLLVAVISVLAARWREPAARSPRPMLVIGIDGAEWHVIRQMWSTGELPALRALAQRGTTATLQTAYSASPVIWTTIATGVTAGEHGITDFVVPGPRGDVPVSSAMRRVPALWNMLSRVHRRVAVVGWWGSWPAEEVDGVVVSDRALSDLDARVFPPTYLPAFKEDIERARAFPLFAAMASAAELRDAAMATTTLRLLREPFDLVLLYFRSADIVSHHSWQELGGTAASAIGGEEVARIYRAIDAAIAREIAAAGNDYNIFVLSDHGFRAARETELRTLSSFDALLVRLGYQTRDAGGVDFSRSKLYSYGSPDYQRRKYLRFSLAGREPEGAVSAKERQPLLDRLETDLKRVTFPGGKPAFLLRPARPREQRAGADVVAILSPDGVSTRVLIDGTAVADVVLEVSRLSGTHGPGNDGVFLAAGPDIEPGADLDGIRVFDIAPTVLYGLDLPVAENFAGRAWTELYSRSYRKAHAIRTIRSWGAPRPAVVSPSAADAALLQELRSLGYIR